MKRLERDTLISRVKNKTAFYITDPNVVIRRDFKKTFSSALEKIVYAIPDKEYNRISAGTNKELIYELEAMADAALIKIRIDEDTKFGNIAESILYSIHIDKFRKTVATTSFSELALDCPDLRFDVEYFYDYLLGRIKAQKFDYLKGKFFTWWNKAIRNHYISQYRNLKQKENRDDSEKRKEQDENPEGTSYDGYTRNNRDISIDALNENSNDVNNGEEILHSRLLEHSPDLCFSNLSKEERKRGVEELMAVYRSRKFANVIEMLCFFISILKYTPKEIIEKYNNTTLREIYDIIICKYSLENEYSKEYVKGLLEVFEEDLGKEIVEISSFYAKKLKSDTKIVGNICLSSITGKNPEKVISRWARKVIKKFKKYKN